MGAMTAFELGPKSDHARQPMPIRARRGVLLAAGGFERNQRMRDEFGVAGSAEWSAGAPGGMGKAIRAGMAIGVATDLMSECWWMPGLIQPNGRSSRLKAEVRADFAQHLAGAQVTGEKHQAAVEVDRGIIAQSQHSPVQYAEQQARHGRRCFFDFVEQYQGQGATLAGGRRQFLLRIELVQCIDGCLL